MHRRFSVANFYATHKGKAFYHQGFRGLGPFTRLQAVPPHKCANAHQDRPGFRNPDHTPTHNRADIDRSPIAFNLGVPQVDVKTTHESNHITPAEVLRADAIFTASQYCENVKVRGKSATAAPGALR